MEPKRKRAQSLFQPNPETDPDFARIHRVHSESDLTTVDRTKPFSETGANDPAELLARVFTALGNIKAADDEAQSIAALSCGAYNGFSDAQILSSEKSINSNWSIQYGADSSLSLPPPRARARAASDVHVPVPDNLEYGSSHDWTWGGNNEQIEEFMRLRRLNKRKAPDLYRTALTIPKSNSAYAVNIDEPIVPTLTVDAPPRTERSQSIFDRLNPFKRRGDAQSRKQSLAPSDSIQNYLEQTAAGRRSCNTASSSPVPSQLQDLFAPSLRRRPSDHSAFSTNDESSANVLENTTIADLIRALEVMHTQAVAGDNNPILDNLLTVPAISLNRTHTVSESQMSTNSINSLQNQQTLPAINILSPSPRDRRASLHPFSSASTSTPLFNRANRNRRQSTNTDLLSVRRSSMLTPPSSSNGPPPYSENTPRTTHRRFSVRPTLLSIEPGKSPMPSIQAVSSLQKRLPTRPSPLTLTDHSLSPMRPNRLGRSISGTLNNYGATSSAESTISGGPMSNQPPSLAPFNQPRPSIQVYTPNSNVERKSSDSN